MDEFKELQEIIAELDRATELGFGYLGARYSVYMLAKIVFNQQERINQLERKLQELQRPQEDWSDVAGAI